MNQLFLTIREAAKVLCIAEKTARNWMTQGKFPIPTFKIESRRVVRIADLVHYADALGNSPMHAELITSSEANVQQVAKRRGRPRRV